MLDILVIASVQSPEQTRRVQRALVDAEGARQVCGEHFLADAEAFGDGPFRRPSKIAAGDTIEFDQAGKKVKGPVLRLVYAKDAKTANGWPRTAGICKAPDGEELEIVFPEEELQTELTWFQAYIKDCRGWLNPQTLLPELVEKKPAKGK